MLIPSGKILLVSCNVDMATLLAYFAKQVLELKMMHWGGTLFSH